MKLTTIAMALALTGCGAQELHKTEMFPGIAEPRTEYDLQVTYVENVQTDWACRKLFWADGLSTPPWGLTQIMACAWTQLDAEVAEGELPVCKVILPHGVGPGDPLYEHEIAHCEGWADPAGTVFEEPQQ